MMKMNVQAVAACGVFAWMTGCNAKSVDLGDDTPPAVLGASLSDYQGDWEGYAEAYRWNDDTDKIRLSLDGTGQGVLEVGDSEPLPPPEAGVGYPPGNSANGSFAAVDYRLVAGFSYPVIDPLVESGRIRLKTQRAALYEEWCALQSPVLDVVPSANPGDGDRYACLPNVGFRGDETGACFLGTDTTPIDCSLIACLTACSCNESSCEANVGVPDLVLDAALDQDGEVLEGTLLENGERITVRMTLTH